MFIDSNRCVRHSHQYQSDRSIPRGKSSRFTLSNEFLICRIFKRTSFNLIDCYPTKIIRSPSNSPMPIKVDGYQLRSSKHFHHRIQTVRDRLTESKRFSSWNSSSFVSGRTRSACHRPDRIVSFASDAYLHCHCTCTSSALDHLRKHHRFPLEFR